MRRHIKMIIQAIAILCIASCVGCESKRPVIIDYKLVKIPIDKTTKKLIPDGVKKAIEDGWEPLASPAYDWNYVTMYQAMVKYKR